MVRYGRVAKTTSVARKPRSKAARIAHTDTPNSKSHSSTRQMSRITGQVTPSKRGSLPPIVSQRDREPLSGQTEMHRNDNEYSSSDDEKLSPTSDEESSSGEDVMTRKQTKETLKSGGGDHAPKYRKQLLNMPTTTTAQQSQFRNTEKTDTPPRPSMEERPQVAPNQRWSNIEAQLKMVTFDKTAVHDFVATTIFPKLKFIAGTDITMQYSTDKKTMCTLVMNGCNQEHSKAGMIWWETARKQTIMEIKRLRNDATKNMKAAFIGKSTFVP